DRLGPGAGALALEELPRGPRMGAGRVRACRAGVDEKYESDGGCGKGGASGASGGQFRGPCRPVASASHPPDGVSAERSERFGEVGQASDHDLGVCELFPAVGEEGAETHAPSAVRSELTYYRSAS